MTKAFETEPVLFLDSNRGVYIPQAFAETVKRDCVSGVSKEDWDAIESGPDNEWYWQTWIRVESSAVLTDPENGQKFTLYQNGDLWLIPEGYDNPDFFEC